jgi:putative ABC transport system permease protein
MTRGLAAASTGSADLPVNVARWYLGTPRGRASVAMAVLAAAAAFTVLGVAVEEPGGADAGSIVLFGLAVIVAEVAFSVGAMAALRPRRTDFATLRALGWPRRSVGVPLLASFVMIGAIVGVLALLLSWPAQLGLDPGERASGWPLAILPASVLMVVTGAWMPARWVTRDRAGRGLARWVAKGALIAGTGMALSLELATRWAWRQYPVPWQVTIVDWAAIVVISGVSVGAVADLDWLAMRERAAESRTLRAMGWSARGLAWMVIQEAALLGSAGGLVAGSLDVVGCLLVAHRMPQRMLWVVLIVILAGIMVSLVAVGLASMVPLPGRDSREAS